MPVSFFNSVEIIKFKAKDFQIIATLLSRKCFKMQVDNMKKTVFMDMCYDFSVVYDVNAIDGILDIHKHLTKNRYIQAHN